VEIDEPDAAAEGGDPVSDDIGLRSGLVCRLLDPGNGFYIARDEVEKLLFTRIGSGTSLDREGMRGTLNGSFGRRCVRPTRWIPRVWLCF
jgi:hypothetical protein